MMDLINRRFDDIETKLLHVGDLSRTNIEIMAHEKTQLQNEIRFRTINDARPQKTPERRQMSHSTSMTATISKINVPTYASAASKPAIIRGNRRAIGGEHTGSGIKTIPRRITVMVNRLDKDTTVEEITEFLTTAGISDVKCYKLEPKEGQTFRTAAF